MDHSGHESHQNHDPGKRGFFANRANLVLIGFLAVSAFYLWTEHRAHLFGWLPFLILLACPLMHIFMHGGHRGHGPAPGPTERKDPPKTETLP